MQPLYDARPTDGAFAANLARSHGWTGVTLLCQEKPAEAVVEYDEAIRIYRKQANPQKTWWRPELAWVIRERGAALQKVARELV